MGGIGSFKLGAQFPDLFARLQPTVGDEGTTDVLASLRNVPVLMWNTHGDELVNNLSFQETADALDSLGYRYELDAFQPCAHPACSPLSPNHLQLAINDWYQPAADFLGTARVERNPAHVTYVLYPARNHPELEPRRRPRLLGLAAQAAARARNRARSTSSPTASDAATRR